MSMSWIPRRGRGRPPHPDLLTPAEWRVLGQLRTGAPNAEIAVRRGVSIKTVRTHVSSILAKTGLPDRQALARWDGRPATASRPSDGGHPWGFVPPWLAVGTTATKVAAGAGTSVVFVAAVIAVYARKSPSARATGADPQPPPSTARTNVRVRAALLLRQPSRLGGTSAAADSGNAGSRTPRRTQPQPRLSRRRRLRTPRPIVPLRGSA